jgi:hypothetical protein
MTTREHINEYFNGRPFMVLCALALMAATVMALSMGVKPLATDGTGIFFSLKGSLIEPGPLSAVINVAGLLTIGAVMLALNKVFSYVRAVTHLFVSAFFLLQLANPSSLVSFNAGTLLGLVTSIAIMPLFASYQDRHSQRSIFLIFALIATGSMFHYGFLALIPAFLLGFFNMGVLNLKGLLAMIFGLITPFWIVMGMGIATPADFVMPHINGIWNLTAQSSVEMMLVLSASTALLGITLAAMNLATIMNYRMQTRVYNAFFVFALVIIVIALCIDYGNVTVYLPLLSLMAAIQMAHSHTLRTTLARRYVFMLLFIAGCIAFCCVNLMMS